METQLTADFLHAADDFDCLQYNSYLDRLNIIKTSKGTMKKICNKTQKKIQTSHHNNVIIHLFLRIRFMYRSVYFYFDR